MEEPSPWASDRPLSNEIAAALIAHQFPILTPVCITGRYEGWDNEAVEVNGIWMFRFPKRAEGVTHFRKELALLPKVAPLLPLSVPRYEFFGEATDTFPYPFAGYPKLVGVPAISFAPDQVNIGAIAPVIGETLSALHTIPANEARDVGVSLAEDAASSVPDAEQEVDDLQSVLPSETVRCCRDYLNAHAGFRRPDGLNRLLHADFSADHLLLAPDGAYITGIIDWTDAEIGDPAFDFGYLWTWLGDTLIDAVLPHYTGLIDAGFRDRVRLYGVCSAIADLHYGLKSGRDISRVAGLRALERFVTER